MLPARGSTEPGKPHRGVVALALGETSAHSSESRPHQPYSCRGAAVEQNYGSISGGNRHSGAYRRLAPAPKRPETNVSGSANNATKPRAVASSRRKAWRLILCARRRFVMK